MSGAGELAVRTALRDALRGDTALMALVQQLSDGEPVKASPPWLLIGDTVATGWGARGIAGLAVRQPIVLTARADDPAAASAILARIDAVLTALDGAIGDWRITSLRLERTRILRSRTTWRCTADYAVRVARLA